MRNGTRSLRRALYALRKTGMRVCEMRCLTWDEVYPEGDTPHLALTRHKTFRITGKSRIVGLDPSTARFFRNLAREYERRCGCDCEKCACDISPHVFTNCRGTPWTRFAFARHLRRTAQAIGLDEGVERVVSGYCLRHMVTVDALKAGISTRQIADQLGNSGDMIDRVYGSHTRQMVEHLSSVAETINRRRKKSTDKKGNT
jgi:integrase